MNKVLFFIALLASLLNPSYASQGLDNEVQSIVEEFYYVFSEYWKNNKTLSKKKPPQLIILNRGSIVLGGCLDRNKKDNYVFAGAEYCGATNTILLDKEELRGYFKVYKSSGVLFLTAHEAAHAAQRGKSYKFKDPFRELHADCVAARLLTFFEPNMTENELSNFLKIAANSGSEIHGTGLDRTNAIRMGLGLIKGDCSPKELYELVSSEEKE